MTTQRVSSTGGANIGWVNASWPLARLTATGDSLDLNTTLLGKYSFSPDQVSSIEQYRLIPILGWGVRIRHCVPTYPKKIVFWCFGSPDVLIRAIQETGFEPSADADSPPPHIGIPARWQAIVAIIVLWNALFAMDLGLPPRADAQPGWFCFLAIFLVFAGSIAMWRVSWLQRFVLKPGRSPQEIKPWLNLLAFVAGVLSVVLFVVLASNTPWEHT